MNKEIKILIVDDEEVYSSTLRYLLSPIYTVFIAENGSAAVEMAQELIPDLILLDIIMPDISGFKVFEELKKHEITQDIPVIFITGLSSVEEEERGFFLGAIDYITKPFVNSLVMARIRNHVQTISHIRTIEQQCLIDVLTKLPNRRSFEERFILEWERAVREEQPISLLFVDMDSFKQYNDKYGHPFGDMLIQRAGDLYYNILKRSTDFVARWGGDEFVILLPHTGFDGACEIADQITRELAREYVICPNGDAIVTTASIGVNTATPVSSDDPDSFIGETDKALYAAKEAGRNRYCSYFDYLLQQERASLKPAGNGGDLRGPGELPKVIATIPAAEEIPIPLIQKIKSMPAVEADRAIAAIGGSAALYNQILTIVIETIIQNIDHLDKSLYEYCNLRMFALKAHGMKTSLKQIGHLELSILAGHLEDAAREKNEAFCFAHYPAFKTKLLDFYSQLCNTEKAFPSEDSPFEEIREDCPAGDGERGGLMKEVLVVDDSVTSLALVSALLGNQYRVYTVNSGEAALSYLEKHSPDLILLDIEMPKINGKEVLRQIRANPRLSDIPVIFLTGDSRQNGEAEAFELGASDYIQKPVNRVVLRRRIEMQLELYHLRALSKPS